jgi:hypothetical protein
MAMTTSHACGFTGTSDIAQLDWPAFTMDTGQIGIERDRALDAGCGTGVVFGFRGVRGEVWRQPGIERIGKPLIRRGSGVRSCRSSNKVAT